MSARVTCPHCGAKNPDARPGKRARCGDCGKPFTPRPRDDEDGPGGSTAVVVVWTVAGFLVCVAVGIGIWMAMTGRGGNPVSPGPVAVNNPPPPPPGPGPIPGPGPNPNPNPPWRDPPIEPTPPATTADPKLQGNWDRAYLTDLAEFDVKMGPWPFGKNGNSGDAKPEHAPIRINGVRYPKGLGMHPPQAGAATVSYALGGRARTLVGAVGFNDPADHAGGPQPVNFQVVGDGRVLWESQPIRALKETTPFRVDVSGVATLQLRAHAAGSAFNCHAVWLDPHLLK